MRELAAHHGDRWRIRRLVGKVVAGENGNSEGVEVPWRGDVEIRRADGLLRTADSREAIGAVAAGKRQDIGDSGLTDGGERCGTIAQLLEEGKGALRCVAVEARINGEKHETPRLESDVDPRGGLEAAQKEACHREQYHGHGDLCDNQHAAQIDTASGCGERVFPFEGAGQARMRGSPCWSHAEQHAAYDAGQKGKEQDTAVEGQ